MASGNISDELTNKTGLQKKMLSIYNSDCRGDEYTVLRSVMLCVVEKVTKCRSVTKKAKKDAGVLRENVLKLTEQVTADHVRLESMIKQHGKHEAKLTKLHAENQQWRAQLKKAADEVTDQRAKVCSLLQITNDNKIHLQQESEEILFETECDDETQVDQNDPDYQQPGSAERGGHIRISPDKTRNSTSVGRKS